MIQDSIKHKLLSVLIKIFDVVLSELSSSGPGPGHCPRLFSKNGLNSCLKRTRDEAIITETPTTHPPPETFKSHCPRLFSKTGLNSCLLDIPRDF